MPFFVVFLSHLSIVGKMIIGREICWSELVKFFEGCGCCLADFFWILEKVSGIESISCFGEQVILICGNVLDKGNAKAFFGKPVGLFGFLM